MSGGSLFDVGVDATQLERLIERYQNAHRDLTPTMQLIAEDLITAVNDRFEGQDFVPLAESTLRRRRREGIGAQILKDTGRWVGSHHPYWGPTYAEAATDTAYAVYHVSEAPRSRIPLRNPYDLPEEVYEEATRTILEELTRL